MKIAEIYHTIQGEGKLVGVPSVFIRTSGCNLRCVWCDTPYASWSPEGDVQSVDAIIEQVATHPTRYVVITGGEPMIAPGIEELTRRLKSHGYHITIETAATVWKDVACDLASVSPKLANSTPWDRDASWAQRHDKDRINLDVIRRFIECGDYQLKFVVDQPEDLAEIDQLLGSLECVDPSNVLLMPQGVTRSELNEKAPWLAEMCKQRGFRYCPRLHIELFGNTRGT